MKAIFIEQYGGPEVIKFQEWPQPTLKPGEVLVKVHCASVNPIDWQIRSGVLKSVVKKKLPFVLGVDFSGQVIEANPGSRFRPGDAVVVSMPNDLGAFSEIVAVAEGYVAPKPKNLTFEEAASFPATALTSLQCLRDYGKIQSGQHVLVNGASGGVGLFGVQLAKALGAGSVTAVCGARSFDWVKDLGADQVIDYRTTDFAKQGVQYDLILDAVHQHSFTESRPALKPRGIHVGTSPKSWMLAFMRQGLVNPFTSQKAFVLMMKPNAKDLEFVGSLFEAGKLRTKIDKVFPATEVVEAQNYSATGRAQGKIVLKFAA